MGLLLNEEQRLLRDGALGWLGSAAPVDRFRAMRDAGSTFSADLWQGACEQGYPGIWIQPEHSGAGFGTQGMGVLAQAMGRNLSPLPLVSSALICPMLIERLGTEAQKREWLEQFAAGAVRGALAVDEAPHHDVSTTELSAAPDGDGHILSGSKTFVMDGAHAQLLLVAARTSGASGELDGLSVFLVDPKTPGLSMRPLSAVDSRDWAGLELDGVRLGADALLGASPGSAGAGLEAVLDHARAVIAAEMLGMAEELFDRTLEYLRERRQFGSAIGSFQGLQHRASWMFCEIELLKSAVHQALSALDERSEEAAVLTSLAKSKAGEVLHLISNEAVQMHGGMGVTDELDLGLFLKRARTLEMLYGSRHFHADRFAELSGY
ncbi:MAG: acyl-CoA dehydrogenase family protein [Gammaproteobacteria bacterium AqS3]|nr:acyl-CoA dehydrogenase family protein [Gammaproteobacteria bacterium AqS3]